MQRTFQSTCWKCISSGHPWQTAPGRDVACCTQRLALGEVLVGKGRLQPRDDFSDSIWTSRGHPAKVLFRCFPWNWSYGVSLQQTSLKSASAAVAMVDSSPSFDKVEESLASYLQYRLINLQNKTWYLAQVMGSWICSVNRRWTRNWCWRDSRSWAELRPGLKWGPQA